MKITNQILEEQEKYAETIQDNSFGKYVIDIAKNVCSHLRLEELFQVAFVESAPELPLKARWSNVPNGFLEEEFLHILGSEIALEITHKGLALVRNLQKSNCGENQKLTQSVKDAIQDITIKTGNKAEWVLTSPEVISFLNIKRCEEKRGEYGFFNIEKVGELGGIAVYQNALFPTGKILVGNRQGFKININKVVKLTDACRLSCDVEYELLNPDNYVHIQVEAMGRMFG